MIKLRKHTNFLLFGIFFFPIVFQSVHIVWHHEHVYKCEHHLCHKEISNQKNYAYTENISEKEKICPICEYQFSLNDLPKLYIKKTEIPVSGFTYIEVTSQQQYKQVFTDKTPRAPPILIS